MGSGKSGSGKSGSGAFKRMSCEAQLIALNALFEAARVGEAARDTARFVAFSQDVSEELARLQWQEVLDALCNPAAPAAATLADLDALGATVRQHA